MGSVDGDSAGNGANLGALWVSYGSLGVSAAGSGMCGWSNL